MSSDWKKFTLREAGVSLIDCDHKTPTAQISGYPYIAIPQLNIGRIDLSDVRHISLRDYELWTKKAKPQADDIILSRRCNPGETAYVPSNLECAIGQNLVLLRSNGKTIYPPFLRWVVRGTEWWNQIEKYMNTGAIFNSLKCAEIPDIKLSIPPLPTQHRIADILSSLDDKIELNRQTNATLEAIAQAIFKEWFVDFNFPGATGEMVESELGLIPKGWKAGVVGDVIKKIPVGKKYDFKSALTQGSVPILDQSHFNIIGYHNETPGVKANIDYPVIVFSNHRCYTDIIQYPFSAIQNVLPFIGNNVDTRWLYCATDGIITYSEYKGHWPDFISKPLIIPPKNLTILFGEIEKPMQIRIMENKNEIKYLSVIRDSLLPKLISGEIEL